MLRTVVITIRDPEISRKSMVKYRSYVSDHAIKLLSAAAAAATNGNRTVVNCCRRTETSMRGVMLTLVRHYEFFSRLLISIAFVSPSAHDRSSTSSNEWSSPPSAAAFSFALRRVRRNSRIRAIGIRIRVHSVSVPNENEANSMKRTCHRVPS